jgi:ferredoxin-NADP reductase
MERKIPYIIGTIKSNIFIATKAIELIVIVNKKCKHIYDNKHFCYYLNLGPIDKYILYKPFTPYKYYDTDYIYLYFAIRIKGTEGMSYYLSTLKKGNQILISDPLVDYRINLSKKINEKIMFISVGTGVTAFIQICYSLIRNSFELLNRMNYSELILILGNKNLKSAILLEEINQIKKILETKIKFKFIKRFDKIDINNKLTYAITSDYLEGLTVFLDFYIELMYTGPKEFTNMIYNTLSRYPQIHIVL